MNEQHNMFSGNEQPRMFRIKEEREPNYIVLKGGAMYSFTDRELLDLQKVIKKFVCHKKIVHKVYLAERK